MSEDLDVDGIDARGFQARLAGQGLIRSAVAPMHAVV